MSSAAKKAKLYGTSARDDLHTAEKAEKKSAGLPCVDETKKATGGDVAETKKAAGGDVADEVKKTFAGGEKDGMIEKLEKSIKDLETEMEELREEAARFEDETRRAKADFYNYRTRVEKDRERDRVLAAERTVDSLLPVLDNLDRTLQAVSDQESPLYKGVAMVQRQFFGAMQALGLRVIDTSGSFDPALHEAMMADSVDDEKDDGMVLAELHRGYMLGDKVLRAAQVKVGKKDK